jgi:hypothetical protein
MIGEGKQTKKFQGNEEAMEALLQYIRKNFEN